MKRNLLKIPAAIFDRLKTFDQDDVVAATVKLLQASDIPAYSGLGLSISEGKLVVPAPKLPNPDAGKYSEANMFGMEKVRRDLPKITKDFGFYAPSWGSGSYHWVSHEREVYLREFFPPKEVTLSIEMVGERAGGFLVKFEIDQVINRRTSNFEKELLYNLNLLQENVGAADVFPSESSLADYAATVHVDWRLLPPGSVDEVMAVMLEGKPPVTPERQSVMKERITAMGALKPEAFITGADGFLRYFGAKFGDDFVAFENANYGNALYIMYDGWEELSRRSRIDLLSGDPDKFDRIVHKDGWKEQFRARVKAYRARKNRRLF